MAELKGLQDGKEQLASELQVLGHKEDFLVGELIAKEDMINEALMGNDDLRRQADGGQT